MDVILAKFFELHLIDLLDIPEFWDDEVTFQQLTLNSSVVTL